MLERIQGPGDLASLTPRELETLAEDIRRRITGVVEKNGGHLASNLGIVETTIALHRVFHSPQDRILWDVGHQSYAHKLLTGRNDRFDTLRTHGGISGFPKRGESEHDIFETGHSTTSLSAAVGIARALQRKGERHEVVAVIGDGSMTGGMAFEAMNDAGHSRTKIIVVLNDNEMSIARNVGALSQVLSRIRYKRHYTRTKSVVQRSLNRIPFIGARVARTLERLKNSFKYLFVTGVFFEELGFAYIGPVDGHDIAAVTTALEHAKLFNRPVLVHVATQKGRGHQRAEQSPERYHSVSCSTSKASGESFAHIVAGELSRQAEGNERVVAITASMTEGCGLEDFRHLYPERFYDVGIAEQHAVTMAAGMAVEGLRPVFAVYSTFLQRAYDQILHDVCLQRLPVLFAVSHCGLVGEDGETHQGIYTLSHLANIPGLRVLCPATAREARAMAALALTLDGPTALCYPKGAPACEEDVLNRPDLLRWGFVRQQEGAKRVILAVGSRMVALAVRAAERCGQVGVAVDVVNCSTVRPLDEGFLLDTLPVYDRAVTLEENIAPGGFGSLVLRCLAVKGGPATPMLVPIAIEQDFVQQGTVAQQMEDVGLTEDRVAAQLMGGTR